ncbi:MAG: B12-binding domain-containing radical SAM protein [Anaerolineae bacterium]|nr:B12-binding domain-containing radical SAM protein [Anaerolineae bacterium]
MKLTLIKPTIGRLEHSLFVDEARMEPLQLGVLAALTPPEVEVVLYDDRIERVPYDEPTDLVAITVESFTARRAYEISKAYRARGVPVVMGGMHVTLLPEEAAQHADVVYTGDAEFRWAEVIADAQRGQLRARYDAPAGIPQPSVLTRRDLFRDKGYLPITLLQFSRGCRFRCEFCAVSAFFNQTQYCRSVEETVAEIEAQGRRELFFVDDNILANHEAAKALFRALIPLKVRWVSQGSLDMTQDRELMALMAASGCLGHVIGFESIHPQSLRAMHKAPNLMVNGAVTGEGDSRGFAHYRPQLEILRDYGLQTWAAFTLGHDYDTVDSLRRTLDFALENKFTFAAFNILMPYPNTSLYRRLEAEDRLLYGGKWWLHPDYRFNYAAFIPKKMTPDDLTEIGFHCRKVFNSIPNIVRRVFDLKTNLRSFYRLGLYAIYNKLFRQETFKKHGMRFGMDNGE